MSESHASRPDPVARDRCVLASRAMRGRCARRSAASLFTLAVLGLAFGGAIGGLGACNSVEKLEQRPRPERAGRTEALVAERAGLLSEVPQIMRGAVASEAVLLGYRDVVVRGFGFVVGLDGTGSRTVPADVRAFMIQEMGRRGVGSPPFDEYTPDELLDSLDTAVVVVEGVLPAGATRGSRFDVRVYAAPGTQTVSLEGGILYTCELRPGPLTAGPRQASSLAKAGGPIFVNPFAEPGTGVSTRIAGRVLDGGSVLRDLPLKLRLVIPSHGRAASVQAAINTHFPREPGQREQTAHGENDESIRITVPPSWRGNTREFIDLVRHTSMSLDAPEAIGLQVRRALLAMPTFDTQAAWRWQALGIRVLPMIQDLYDYPEERPRIAALRAGARLNDQLVVPHLVEIARDAPPRARMEAIELLGEMGLNPDIDRHLRALLDDNDIDVRLAAFEALVERRDPTLIMASPGGKFELYAVPSKKPLIYLTQTGVARLVVFGVDAKLSLPITLQAWSNRVMIKGDLGGDTVEVFYRARDGQGRIIADGPLKLFDFIRFLAHRPSPEDPRPGLNLRYGEVVGLLHELWKNRFLGADFRSEQDRLLAAILRVEADALVDERPEFGDPDFDYLEVDEDLSPTIGDLESLRQLPPGSGPTRGGIVPR